MTMLTYTRWCDYFGDQVSKLREARTGLVTLLHNAEVEAIPDMEQALDACWREGIKPRVAAVRYVALVDRSVTP